MTVSSLGLDADRDTVEQGAQVATEQGNRGDDDNGDQGNHEAILNRGGTTVVAHCDELGLELDETREHFGPLRRTGSKCQKGSPGTIDSLPRPIPVNIDHSGRCRCTLVEAPSAIRTRDSLNDHAANTGHGYLTPWPQMSP